MFYSGKHYLCGMFLLFVLCYMMGKNMRDDIFISIVNKIQIANKLTNISNFLQKSLLMFAFMVTRILIAGLEVSAVA